MTWMHQPYQDSGGEEYDSEAEQALGALSAEAQEAVYGTVISLAAMVEPFIAEDGDN